MEQMKQWCSVTVRYLAVFSLLMVLCCKSVFAAGDRYESKTGKYSFVMPEGYSASSLEGENQESFTGTDGANFNIAVTENSFMTESMMGLVSDQITEEIVNQYKAFGISEDKIEKEGLFTTEENDRNWIGIALEVFGVKMHQCITCSDKGDSFTVTFTSMDPEDEQLVLNSFETGSATAPESGSATDPVLQNDDADTDQSQSAQDGAIEYTLMDGKMKLNISDEFNVLIKGETQITDEIAASFDTDKERLELYLSMQGSDLLAVRKGESLSGGNSGEIHVRIKPDKYNDISNLADLSELEQNMIAKTLISGFPGIDDYELYKTSDACFIVFEVNMMGNEIRYATVIDGAMIYVFYHLEDGDITDQDRQMMRDIVDTVHFM